MSYINIEDYFRIAVLLVWTLQWAMIKDVKVFHLFLSNKNPIEPFDLFT